MITIEREKVLSTITLGQLKQKETFECAGQYYIVSVYEYDEEETTKIAINLVTGVAREGFSKMDILRKVNLSMKKIPNE